MIKKVFLLNQIKYVIKTHKMDPMEREVTMSSESIINVIHFDFTSIVLSLFNDHELMDATNLPLSNHRYVLTST